MKFPKHISNQPIREDFYEGKSQLRLANTIKEYMVERDSATDKSALSRIIGIEGGWGSGKSNVVNKLRSELGDSYFFYIHDAWGMQEDLQRRSILQSLTNMLIDKQLLEKMTYRKEINPVNRTIISKSCSWSERLEFLCGNRASSVTETTPSISEPAKYFALLIVYLGLSIPLVSILTQDSFQLPFSCQYGQLITLLVFTLPPIIFFLCYLFWRKNRVKELWRVYGTSGETTTTCETISALEPSVSEFRSWMHDVSKEIADKKKHLVVVFDNMDRLPANKVKQLWSSIHTFFAETSANPEENLSDVWCIIPYDESNLCDAFDNKEDICKKFLLKTFPVIYRVPKPVVTDYRVLFETFLKEAFGENCEEQDMINKCYRQVNPEPNPRNIIYFINELVTLKKAWKEEIPLDVIALYVLNKNSILHPSTKGASVDDVLLSHSYIGSLDKYFKPSEDLLTYMSMMVYGVEKKIATQLPLTNYLNYAIAKGATSDNNLKDKMSNSNFFTVFDEIISKEDDVKLENIVKVLYEIDIYDLGDEDKQKITKTWDSLAKIYIASKNKEESFLEGYIEKLIKYSGQAKSKEVSKAFVDRFINTKHENGEIYFKALDKLEDVWDECLDKQERIISIPEINLPPQLYIDYVIEAKSDYSKYNIKAEQEELQDYILEKLESDVDYFPAIELLLNDGKLNNEELETILKEDIEDKKFKGGHLQRALKLLTLVKKVDTSYNFDPLYITNQIGTTKPEVAGTPRLYAETYLLLSSGNADIEEEDYDAITSIAIKAQPTCSIWEFCLNNYNSPNLVKIFQNIIKKSIISGEVGTDLVMRLHPSFDLLGIGQKELLEYLNQCGYTELSEVESDKKVDELFSSEYVLSWAETICSIDNQLTKTLCSKIQKDVLSQSVDKFYTNNYVPSTTIWAKLLNLIIEKGKLTTTPGCLAPVYEKFMLGIEQGTFVEGHETPTYIFLRDRIEYKKISSTFDEIKTRFYNGKNKMTAFKYIQLHKWFEQNPVSEADASNYLNKCLCPLVENDSIHNIILNNPGYYKDVIEKYIDDSSDLRKWIESKLKSDSEDDFTKFLRSLNIPEDEEVK